MHETLWAVYQIINPENKLLRGEPKEIARFWCSSKEHDFALMALAQIGVKVSFSLGAAIFLKCIDERIINEEKHNNA